MTLRNLAQTSVHDLENDSDLARVLAVWRALSEHVLAAIFALEQSAHASKCYS